MLLGKYRAIYLTWTLYAVFIFTPLVESSLLKTWLKVERSSLQFINLNLLRTKRNENWTFWGSPFLITIWLVYVIHVWWPDQGPCTQILLWILSKTLVLKFNLSTEFCLQFERTFLVHHVHQKLAFLTHLIAYAWFQNISKQFKEP